MGDIEALAKRIKSPRGIAVQPVSYIVYPTWHMPRAAETTVFTSSDGLACRAALFGTRVERHTAVFGIIATHLTTSSQIRQVILALLLSPLVVSRYRCKHRNACIAWFRG